MSGSNNPVLSLEVQDNLSPGAQAATDALTKLGDAAETTETKVTRVGVSAAALVNRLVPLSKAQADLVTQGATLDRGLAAGTITAEQHSAAMATLQQRVRAASEAHKMAAGAIEDVGAHTRATTMLINSATGAFAELSAGMSPLAIAVTHMGHLEHATETFGLVARQAFAFVTSGPGIALSAASIFGAIAISAENAADRIVKLQAALQAVNSNPVASAQVGNTAARMVANTGVVSLADSTAAAVAFLNQPSVVQAPANIERLIKDSVDLAAIWEKTVPEAAARLAAGMSEPGKMADELAKEHFLGMNDELARSITLQADAGDKAGAYAKVLGVVEKAAHDAANTSKTELQKALDDLRGAFTKTGADGKTFGDTIGTSILHVTSGAVESIADMVRALEKAYSLINSLNLPDWAKQAISTAYSAASGALNPVGSLIGTATGLINGTTGTSGVPRGIRNNNPLNLEYTGLSGGATGTDGRFAIYPDMATGVAAAQSQLLRYQDVHGLNTVGGIINRWAPPGENNTGGYALSVAQSLGVTVDQPIDLHNPTTMQALTQAMSNVENGRGYNLATVGSSPTPTGGQVIPVSGAASVNNPAQTIQDALAKAVGGTSTGALEDATKNVTLYRSALADLAAQGITSGRDVDILTEALTKATKAQFDAIGPAAQLIRVLKEQTAQQDELATAWSGGYAAEAQAVAQVKAEQQARTVAAPGTAAYTDAVERLTAAQLALAAAQQSVQAGAALADQAQQVQYLQAETATLGESASLRARDLAVLKEQQTIEKTLPGISQQQKDALLAGAAAIADQNTNLQQTQAALQEVGNLATQAFDQIGSAISNSFLSGTGAAINWGNTVKAVVGTVIQQVAKLAILNPIINTITGGNSPTLLSVGNALATGGNSPTLLSVGNALATGSANGQGGAFGMLSNAGTFASTANTLSGGWLGNSLGITGPNGVFSGNGMLSGAYNYLFGAGAGSTNAATLAAQPVGFASDAANAATYGSTSPGIFSSGGSLANFANTPVLGSGTIGTFATGVGAGYGIGSLAGGYLQGALGKTGPAPQIGAGVGALAGAAIGSIIPGVGTVLGGVIGGTLGGAGGGLIGPHKANEFSSVSLTAPGGFLDLSHPVSQLDSNFPAEVDQAHAYAAALNDLLTQSGIRLSLGGIKEIGTAAGPNKAADLASAFPKFQFTVPDTSTDQGRVLAGQVNGQSFSGLDQLQSVFTEVSTFINQTVPALKAFDPASVGIGSLATALNNLHATFDPAVAEAQKLGFAEQDLTDARDKAVAAVQAQVATQTHGYEVGIQSSYLSAVAQVTGKPADAQAAALYAFSNVTVPQATDQLKQEYQAIFGDAYATNQQYAEATVALEQSLSEQRLAIQTQFNNQAVQAAGASITSLLSYVQKLQGSSVSPLSPLDQYAQARSQFNAVSGAARAGDYNSITNLPTYADALLSTSRNVNGSGIGYVNDYNSVLSSVSSVASLGPDALTQAFMAAQTAQLDGTLNRILSAIGDLQTALTRAAMAPARIAA